MRHLGEDFLRRDERYSKAQALFRQGLLSPPQMNAVNDEFAGTGVVPPCVSFVSLLGLGMSVVGLLLAIIGLIAR